MSSIRTAIFWLHFSVAGFAGLVIFILCISGVALGIAQPVQEWHERALRHPGVPRPDSVPLGLDRSFELAVRGHPSLRISAAVLSADPGDSIVITAADHSTWFLNPYTGALTEESAPRLKAFFRTMASVHTVLGLNPNLGVPIAATANIALLFLTLSGLWLWWPRRWTWRNLRPVIWFVRGARGRARDWNWHNVVAIWFLPIILILAATGVVLSYRWANDDMYAWAAKHLKPGAQPVAVSLPSLKEIPSEGFISPGQLVDAVRQKAPSWWRIRLEMNPPLGPGPANSFSAHQGSISALVAHGWEWPPFDRTVFTLDRARGTTTENDSYASGPPGRRARAWVRLLHSGDALGWPGQIGASIGCLAGCFLVYTGYALAWRRMFFRKPPSC